MVGLDLTAMDQVLIKYVADLARIIKPEKIYFVNAQPELEHGEDLLDDYPELHEPVDEHLEERLREEVLKHFKGADQYDIDYKILEGKPFEELLQWTKIKNIDLLLVGRKKDLKGSGILPTRLAHKVMCSILFVPQKATLKLDNIYLAADFSEHSDMAFEEALRLAKGNENATINVFNSFTLPSGYYKTGKSEEEFVEIMNDHAVKKYNKMIERFDVEHVHIQPVFKFDEENAPAQLMNEIAHQNNADLILIGARGRTATTAMFLGSVTEKLLTLDSDIPLLIVKDKNKTFDFLELLKKI